MFFSLGWSLPWLGAVHDATFVLVKVAILFRVSEFGHNEPVSNNVGEQVSHTEFSVTLGLRSIEWQELETLSIKHGVG